jgi:3',5'-nucleoside bisphosphate phosphatase
MNIDMHIHSAASDGKFTVAEIIGEAKARGIEFMAISDHDNISCQTQAIAEAKKAGIRYITGVELNVAFSNPKYKEGKAVSLDFLGYQFDQNNTALKDKLAMMAQYRQERAAKILDNLNTEFAKENIAPLTAEDFHKIEESVDGTLGRPHIADYLVKKGIVASRQEAFDRYLVKCDVPKYPLYLEEASNLVRDAGGKLVLAHGNDPHGTSLAAYTKDLAEQTAIIKESILLNIDGLECWHTRHTPETTSHYLAFTKENGLLATGGSDCHQKPVVMGTLDIPSWVAEQFK